MRKTGQVTQREVPVGADQQLISATDPKSRITHCNQVFVEISGYTEDELIGEGHNILRHPDMPQEAFRMLWDRVQSGKPWMGLVKNRCKNGDHYWVDAYVMPVWEGDTIVGYESVRIKTEPAMQRRAERLYARLNKGQKPFSSSDYLQASLPFAGVGALLAIMAQQHHINTVLGRMRSVAAEMETATENTSTRIHQVAERVNHQRADTDTVASAVHEMTATIQDAVVAIERSHEEAEAGVEAINQVSARMESILEAVADIERGTDNISTAASEQEVAANEIAESTTRIAEGAEATYEDMNAGAAQVDAIRRQAAEQASLIDRFSR